MQERKVKTDGMAVNMCFAPFCKWGLDGHPEGSMATLKTAIILYIKTEFANYVPVWGFSKSRIRHEYLLFWFPKFIILCLNS